MTATPNAAQAEAWNNAAGPTWVRFQAELDHQLEPLGRRALQALAARPGERILDVGCGSGATTVEIARQVGASGAVTGIDISEVLLDAARARPISTAAGALNWLNADAQTTAIDPPFDAIFSRFGVMFFDDPVAAFANLRAAAPSGRLAFVCWRAPADNPWMSLPLQAAADLVPAPAPTPPGAPGPFAFADADHVRAILADAGWRDTRIAPFDTAIGPGDTQASARLMTRIGPLGLALREAGADKAVIAAAEGRVREALAPHVQGDRQVRIPAGVWIVTARA